ncbi:hemerythrin domain-containing protein [Herbidospora daliensis]|uniref:hemerythrin domain-containing protein n=1 Tax=Herbidospora daliensis TaxID=295585 RepID=UPI0007818508|nr:hemerythrin domain-containing protein [Herbidospora daliensis]
MSIDLTMMYAFHDALRRELDRIARLTETPGGLLKATVTWDLFTTYLHIHHTSEDDALWPALREVVPETDLALLDAMEAEHGVIDPALAAVEASTPADVAENVAVLRDRLTAHLRHEERETLPLIAATLPPQEWARFGALHRGRVGDDTGRYLPWLLDSAVDDLADRILAAMPESIRTAYRDEWLPGYLATRAVSHSR